MAVELDIQSHELEGTKLVARLGDTDIRMPGEVVGIDSTTRDLVVRLGEDRLCRAPQRLGQVGFSSDLRGKYRLFLQPMSPIAKEACLGFALPAEFHQFEQKDREAKTK